ncbi:MAG: hypothetical protein AAF674_16600 [Pseudomonadota bacterium]
MGKNVVYLAAQSTEPAHVDPKVRMALELKTRFGLPPDLPLQLTDGLSDGDAETVFRNIARILDAADERPTG